VRFPFGTTFHGYFLSLGRKSAECLILHLIETKSHERLGDHDGLNPWSETLLHCTLSWKGGSQWTIKSVSDTARNSDSKLWSTHTVPGTSPETLDEGAMVTFFGT
jgi:hypothetical protein